MGAKKFKNGHILQDRKFGFRYKLVGEIVSNERGAYAKYIVCHNGRLDGLRLGPGFFPFDDYKIVRLTKVVAETSI